MRLMMKVCASLTLSTLLTGCCCMPGCYDGGYYNGSTYGGGYYGGGYCGGGHCGAGGGLFGCGLFPCLQSWLSCHHGGYGGYGGYGEYDGYGGAGCCDDGFSGYGPSYYPDAQMPMIPEGAPGGSYYVPGETVIPQQPMRSPQSAPKAVPAPIPEPGNLGPNAQIGPQSYIIPQSYVEPAPVSAGSYYSPQPIPYQGPGQFSPRPGAARPYAPRPMNTAKPFPIYGGKVIR